MHLLCQPTGTVLATRHGALPLLSCGGWVVTPVISTAAFMISTVAFILVGQAIAA